MTTDKKIITVSAYEARAKFGELVNLILYQGKKVRVERRGKPVIEMRMIDADKKKSKGDAILKYAGSWNDEEGRKIAKFVREQRPKWKFFRDYGDELSD